MTQVIRYDPPITDHPSYDPEVPDFEAGDVVETLVYNGHRTIRDDDGNVVGSEDYLSDSFVDKNESFTMNNYLVREIDGFRVKVIFGPPVRDKEAKWIPKDMIVGVDDEKKAEFESRIERKKEEQRQRKEREGQDLDFIMEEIIKPHARSVVADTWPGGTVNVDEIDWFWNPHLSDSAGKAYLGQAVPESMASGRLAIGLAPGYYHKHGIDELLNTVRHELIHIWQFEHPDAKGGHGPKFKQWVDELNTERHCKHW